ncbi:glycosyltransferase family 2 protein [Paenibacillus aquistagni]|uniref:glycosyltransferase family 2 protein n=1 Tax=Paenibacillus aquistagni TaxID=1852522 RepID=UPI00145AD74B|nr:glycosyltransferase [Paenibacillus aquistagni]NMM51997.1 glycosyltransferase [Paenibacillus aquistagni]
MNPLVTIVIPFYNDPYVPEAIESALGQTYSPIEVIVVDDGSSQHADRLQPYRSRIHYLGKSNGGTASALNHGLRCASGKYIAWLSSDDKFYPTKVSEQVAYMEQYQAMISFTDFDYMNMFSQVTKANAAQRYLNVFEFYNAFFTYNPINGCTVMFRQDLIKRIGMFNEQLPYTHDLDLWFRTILAGTDIHFIPLSLTAYRWHEGMGTLRHQPAVEHEMRSVIQHYHDRLAQFIQQLIHR